MNAQPAPIRILVVDDHPVVRKGLIAMLETEPDLQIVGEGRDGEEAVAQALALQPDVILMDLVMPRLDGLQAIEQIKSRQPGAQILVLTSFTTADKVMPALQAGATGYMLKESEPAELVNAIHTVQRGESYLHPSLTRQLLSRLAPTQKGALEEELTERELDVARCVARGLSNAEIAQELVVSEATVHTHINKILTKLHLSNRTQIALYALRRGLVQLD